MNHTHLIAELEGLIEWHENESRVAPDFDDRCKSRNAVIKYSAEVERLKRGEQPTLPTMAEAHEQVTAMHRQFSMDAIASAMQQVNNYFGR